MYVCVCVCVYAFNGPSIEAVGVGTKSCPSISRLVGGPAQQANDFPAQTGA